MKKLKKLDYTNRRLLKGVKKTVALALVATAFPLGILNITAAAEQPEIEIAPLSMSTSFVVGTRQTAGVNQVQAIGQFSNRSNFSRSGTGTVWLWGATPTPISGTIASSSTTIAANRTAFINGPWVNRSVLPSNISAGGQWR